MHSELAAIINLDGLAGLAARRADSLDLRNYVHAIHNRTEDHILAVQPCRLHRAQEEL